MIQLNNQRHSLRQYPTCSTSPPSCKSSKPMATILTLSLLWMSSKSSWTSSLYFSSLLRPTVSQTINLLAISLAKSGSKPKPTKSKPSKSKKTKFHPSKSQLITLFNTSLMQSKFLQTELNNAEVINFFYQETIADIKHKQK